MRAGRTRQGRTDGRVRWKGKKGWGWKGGWAGGVGDVCGLARPALGSDVLCGEKGEPAPRPAGTVGPPPHSPCPAPQSLVRSKHACGKSRSPGVSPAVPPLVSPRLSASPGPAGPEPTRRAAGWAIRGERRHGPRRGDRAAGGATPRGAFTGTGRRGFDPLPPRPRSLCAPPSPDLKAWPKPRRAAARGRGRL